MMSASDAYASKVEFDKAMEAMGAVGSLPVHSKAIEVVAAIREKVSEHVAMQALCSLLSSLSALKWLPPAGDDMGDPDGEILRILRALPLPGMPAETVMAAYAWTTNDTPEIAEERARLAALVVKMLTEAT